MLLQDRMLVVLSDKISECFSPCGYTSSRSECNLQAEFYCMQYQISVKTGF